MQIKPIKNDSTLADLLTIQFYNKSILATYFDFRAAGAKNKWKINDK